MTIEENAVTSDPTREPLFQKATVVAAVTSIATLAAAFGVHVAPGIQDAVVQVTTVVAILVPFVTAWLARKHVTPVSDPRDHDGTPLGRVQSRGGDVPAPTGDAAP